MDELLSQKHKRLLNIADSARVGAWLLLITYSIVFVLQLVNLAKDLQSPHTGYGSFQVEEFGDAPDFVAIALRVVYALRYGLSGVVWFLLLKGVSLGLRVIVETDVNYRLPASPEEAS